MCAQLAETLIPEEENEKQVPVADYFKESGEYCLHAFAQDAHEVNKKMGLGLGTESDEWVGNKEVCGV